MTGGVLKRMATFGELYGITFHEDDEGNSLAELRVTKSNLNWYGKTFGGCFMFLAGNSAQHLVGEEYAANSYVTKFLRKAELGDVITARTTPIKIGSRSAVTETHLCIDENLIGVLYADFYKRCETVPFTIEADFLNAERPPYDFIINSEEDPHFAHDHDAFCHMFCLSTKYDEETMKNVGKFSSISMFTDDSFAGIDGNIDPSIYGTLADSLASLLCWRQVGHRVTADISTKILATVKPGAFLTCSCENLLQTGSLVLARGLFWADETCIGMYSATFMKI